MKNSHVKILSELQELQDAKDEIIKQLAEALQEFMDVWSSGDATAGSKRAMQRRADMWNKAKTAIKAAKGVGL